MVAILKIPNDGYHNINFEFSVMAIFFLMDAIAKAGDMSTHLV